MSETQTAVAPSGSSLRAFAISSSRVWAITAVTAAVALGAFLRLFRIDSVGLNSDEAVYAGQAASIANVHGLNNFFPIFRAHPLLIQAILSIPFHFGARDVYARVLTTAFGLGTIVLVYLLGRMLYGRPAGIAAAFVLAAMPYHVVVSRQVLLDGPMTFFATLALYCLASFAVRRRTVWLYAAGGAMGLTFLSKETGILLLGSIYAFIALSPSIRVKLRDLAIAFGVMVVTILPYPISLAFAGKTSTGEHYLVWQLFRRANHSMLFYPTKLPLAFGPLALIAAAAGLVLLRRWNTWRETLLLSWIAVPAIFLELWPVKGFHYLLTSAPVIAVLAGRLLGAWPADGTRFLRAGARTTRALLTAVVVLSLAFASLSDTRAHAGATFLAGSGGVPGGRETGTWVRDHVPEGASMLAIGPSMANIVQFYGLRKVYGLSVSPNPLHRNPSYVPIGNPDLRIRHNDVQYVIWDAYSAKRSPFFAHTLLRYADRYHGRIVYSTFAGSGKSGTPTIQVYAVRP